MEKGKPSKGYPSKKSSEKPETDFLKRDGNGTPKIQLSSKEYQRFQYVKRPYKKDLVSCKPGACLPEEKPEQQNQARTDPSIPNSRNHPLAALLLLILRPGQKVPADILLKHLSFPVP